MPLRSRRRIRAVLVAGGELRLPKKKPMEKTASSPKYSKAVFSELELTVIALAHQRREYDDRASSTVRSGFTNYIKNLIGNPRPQRLANEQLESLRRLVSELRFRSNGPHSDTVSFFLENGYDLKTLETLRREVPFAICIKAERDAASSRRRPF